MNMIPKSLDALRVPIDTLQHYSKNPRTGNVELIVESLRVNGQYRPLVVNSRNGEVLAGNHTLKAARALGWDEIAVTFVDADDDEAARIVLVDNRSNDLAEYDDSALVELLASIDDLAGTGFDQDALDMLTADVAVPEFDEQPDQPSLDTTVPRECPSCHYKWRLDGQGNEIPA